MELKRRDFLKITGLLGTGFFGKVNINEADPYNVWKPIIPDQLEKAETVCPLCNSTCSLEILKKRELIFGIYNKDKTKGLCPKIAAYHNIIYGVDRIKTPLLRVKERGSFSFKPIDYDKASQILKEKINNAETYTDAIATGESERFYLSAISTKINFIPDNRLKAVCGADKIYFDLENASLVLNFGADLLTDGNFLDAANYLSKNAKNVITFSPIVTKGTALGEKWYPVKLSQLPSVAKALKVALSSNISNNDFPFLSEIVARVKNVKNICVTFSPSLLEFEEGLTAVKEIISLATFLNAVNKPGGVYFYNTSTTSKPFNLFKDRVSNYLAYNVDPTLVYPVNELHEKLREVPFIVYFGHHHSDFSKYADLILPLPFFVEKKEIYIKRHSKGLSIIKADFAVEGGVESQELRKKENIEVIFQKLLNFKAPYGIKGIDEVAKAVKPSLPTLTTVISSIEKKVSVSTVQPKFPENKDVFVNDKDIELFLFRNNVLDFDTQGSKWAEELDNSNPVLMNSNTAAKLKIKKGDKVVIKTPKGVMKLKVFIFDGIVNDTVALNRFKKRSALGSPYKLKKQTKNKETKHIWWSDESVELELLTAYSDKSLDNLALISSNKIEIIKG